MNGDLAIKRWGDVFRYFQQVENVKVNYAADRLDISIRGRNKIVKISGEELNDSLYKYKGNPHEVATYFLRLHGAIVYCQNTLVGLFDIQAYSEFIGENNSNNAIKKVSNFVSQITNVANADILALKLENWILSDSIVVVIDTTRHPLFSGSIEAIFAVCSHMLWSGMFHGFPLRGAIGGGDFYKDGEIMVSSGLVDAAKYEKEQEWLGAVITPNALKMIEKAKEIEIELKGKTDIDFLSEKFKPSVRYGRIPWKKEKEGGKNIDKPSETWYLKPISIGKDWEKNCLPSYFKKSSKKVDNSDCLYGH